MLLFCRSIAFAWLDATVTSENITSLVHVRTTQYIESCVFPCNNRFSFRDVGWDLGLAWWHKSVNLSSVFVARLWIVCCGFLWVFTFWWNPLYVRSFSFSLQVHFLSRTVPLLTGIILVFHNKMPPYKRNHKKNLLRKLDSLGFLWKS